MRKKKCTKLFTLLLVSTFALLGCFNKDNNGPNDSGTQTIDDATWTNKEMLLVHINENCVSDVFNNLDTAFNNYDFKRLYVFNKNIEKNQMSLLLIFSNASECLDIRQQLIKDNRISSAYFTNYIPL